MKLLIISHTPHYRKNGIIVGWGPTVREIDHLACLFDEVVHLAPLHTVSFQESALPYCAKNVTLHLVSPAGGERIIDKIGVIKVIFHYLLAIILELRKADAVHVRCPANISLLAIIVLAFMRRPRLRWVKYAGSWDSRASLPLTSKFQQWWLNLGLHRGFVTVNGQWPDQPDHVRSFYNPSFDNVILEKLRKEAVTKKLTIPLKIMFAGRLSKEKGAWRVIRVVKQLHEMGIPIQVDMFGNGPELLVFRDLVAKFGIREQVIFHGWMSHSELLNHYLRAHIVFLPSDSEGWPKVLSEGMACGAVPVASQVGSIRQILQRFGIGKICAIDDLEGYVSAISDYYENPQKWKRESELALEAAHFFTYDYYVNSVCELLGVEKNKVVEKILSAKESVSCKKYIE